MKMHRCRVPAYCAHYAACAAPLMYCVHTISEQTGGSYVKAGDECTTEQDQVCTPCPNKLPAFGSWTGAYDKEMDKCEFKCGKNREADLETDSCPCLEGD
jgi:hypothetical protein